MTIHTLPSIRHKTIRHLDGRLFATAGFIHDRGDVWDWISNTVARELECSPESVAVLETDEGDMLTVDGLPTYRLF